MRAPGLRDLARALAEDHEVIVAAPATDVSGAGTSMGALDAADPTRLERQDFDGIEAYGLDGPPGLAVLAASLGAFGDRPDVVVSGPNAGLNTGRSIIHSGTVGAALTGRTFGSKAIAFSLAPGDRWYWETAAAIAGRIVAWAVARDQPTTLNVNVPALPLDRCKGSVGRRSASSGTSVSRRRDETAPCWTSMCAIAAPEPTVTATRRCAWLATSP